jgi:hypothetical protein
LREANRWLRAVRQWSSRNAHLLTPWIKGSHHRRTNFTLCRQRIARMWDISMIPVN